jgi:hypothetical protein
MCIGEEFGDIISVVDGLEPTPATAVKSVVVIIILVPWLKD